MDEVKETTEDNSSQELVIYQKIDHSLCGKLLKLSKNKAEVLFAPNENMISDEDIIHTGFIFNAASYTAMCALNKKNSIIISSETKFLAPIELNHQIIFKANVLQGESKKCEVKVEGFLLDIKIFDGMFYIAILDKKLFKLRLKDNEDKK